MHLEGMVPTGASQLSGRPSYLQDRVIQIAGVPALQVSTGVLLAMAWHTFTRPSRPATASDMCLGVMSEDALSSGGLSSCFGFFVCSVWASASEASSRSSCFLLLPDAWLTTGMSVFEELLGPARGGVPVPESRDAEPEAWPSRRPSPRSTARCGGTSSKGASLPCCDVERGRVVSGPVFGVVMSCISDKLREAVRGVVELFRDSVSQTHQTGPAWLPAHPCSRSPLPFFSLLSSSVSFWVP